MRNKVRHTDVFNLGWYSRSFWKCWLPSPSLWSWKRPSSFIYRTWGWTPLSISVHTKMAQTRMMRNVSHPDLFKLEMAIIIPLKVVVAIPIRYQVELAIPIYIESGGGHHPRSLCTHRKYNQIWQRTWAIPLSKLETTIIFEGGGDDPHPLSKWRWLSSSM